MQDSSNRSTVQVLEDLHTELGSHFSSLHAQRDRLTPAAPVFALEHGISEADLGLLKDTVRSAVRQGFGAAFRRYWLPFVIYAAESGYEYAGGEYWLTFEESTPWWREHGDRYLIRQWFQRFADRYGGAVPQGAFADYYTIIAWPITHAVLPVYLQRNLAHLLFDFRTGLTAQLLHDPDALGARLASRTGSYTERFRLFCQNTALLGKISVALLSGEDDDSPYLLRPTLRRLVDGLSREQDSRRWLEAARRSAAHLRTRTHGFARDQRPSPRPPRTQRLPSPTDPRLSLRRRGDEWLAFAELPDLSPLLTRMPQLAGDLRNCRASIAGAERSFVPGSQLLFPGYSVRLARWPRPGEPFISLQRAPDPVNHLIADQCAMSPGPAWLFRRRASGLAVEVKGKTMHPGSSYILVMDDKADTDGFPAAAESSIGAGGVRAFDITVPDAVSEPYAAAFARAGVTVIADVTIRPTGIVPSSWDGEGAVEWLAGEPGMIGIRAEQPPATCVVTVDGQPQALHWPAGQTDLLLWLDDLTIGTSEAIVTLIAESGKTIAEGSIIVTVRDPQVRPEGAAAGEGIRLLSDPAQPTLSDLWDGRAVISIDGPSSRPATLAVTLLSDTGEKLSEIAHDISLPLTPEKWPRTAAVIRADHRLNAHYDDAQTARVTVSQSGIGSASLTCDRGFQPLRWRMTRRHDGNHEARLIDRTDGNQAMAELFRVCEPVTPLPCSSSGCIAVPAQGGLLRARAGDATATILLPTQPNDVMRHRNATPAVSGSDRVPRDVMCLASAHLMWSSAERPADPFAGHQCAVVLDAITGEIASLIGQGYWAGVERRMRHATDLTAYVDDMKACVGTIGSHKELADRISRHLWAWPTPQSLLAGFTEALTVLHSKAAAGHDVPRFLLTLADQPGRIMTDWSPSECEDMLAMILASPVLLRAARFAVLGARAYHQNVTAGGQR
jgi:hypothetical protein